MENVIFATTTLLWIAACYSIADFLTGVVHWAEDTWTAPGRSEFLDRYIVLDNIEHHRHPGTIRGGSYWLTNRPSILIASGASIALALCGVHVWQIYLVLAIGSQGNQVHKWAHTSDRPAVVAWLQEIGLLQSRRHHGIHHIAPYAVNFCALTNYLNPVLDAIGFWRGLESFICALGATNKRGTAARGGL